MKHPLKIDSVYLVTELPLESSVFRSILVGQRVRILSELPCIHPTLRSAEVVVLSGKRTGDRLVLLQAGLLHDPPKAVCRCTAYSYPHQTGKGQCPFRS